MGVLSGVWKQRERKHTQMDAFIDALTTEAGTMVTNVGLAATAALGIFGVIYGIRLAVKAFRAVGK